MPIVIGILVALLISLGICLFWRSKMKTAKIAKTADNYIPANGFRLTVQADTYLYRTTTRRRIDRK